MAASFRALLAAVLALSIPFSGLGESHLIANAELGDGCCGGVGVFQNLGANKVGGACPDTSHDKPDEASLLTVPQFTSPVAYFWELAEKPPEMSPPEMAAARRGPPTPVAATAIPPMTRPAPIRKSRERIRSLWAVHQWLIGSVM
ncbi:hypothetical protein JCM18918_3002 [Cutibacterium acnes JCM 18918]|nr:hypothetical protein JCM18918_3002 [Cutibacterium acnes JCM 18918]